jgi:hypothetical protein
MNHTPKDTVPISVDAALRMQQEHDRLTAENERLRGLLKENIDMFEYVLEYFREYANKYRDTELPGIVLDIVEHGKQARQALEG